MPYLDINIIISKTLCIFKCHDVYFYYYVWNNCSTLSNWIQQTNGIERTHVLLMTMRYFSLILIYTTCLSTKADQYWLCIFCSSRISWNTLVGFKLSFFIGTNRFHLVLQWHRPLFVVFLSYGSYHLRFSFIIIVNIDNLRTKF